MVLSSVLGFPRIGANREVKKLVESYFSGKISELDLQKIAADVRKTNWHNLKEKQVDLIPSGDFTLYDHVLDHSVAFNVVPKRYARLALSKLDLFFALGGERRTGSSVDLPPKCEMKSWFDTNYHYFVPEISEETDFKLLYNKPLEEFKEAKTLGLITRPVVLGPVSYLFLGKADQGVPANFEPLSLLPKILLIYEKLLSELKAASVDSVQIDEPILVLDKAADLEKEYATAYAQLAPVAPKIVLTTYFARLDSNVNFIAKLPIYGLHIDLSSAPKQLDSVLEAIKSTQIVLSLGVVSGRNIWKADFTAAIEQGKKAITSLGEKRVIIATSSSLLHTPVTLANEKRLTAEQKDWFSFALEKAAEVSAITAFLANPQNPRAAGALEDNKASIAKRRDFERTSDDAVRKRVGAITPDLYKRKKPFADRREVQAGKLRLPRFPTTTMGSFPRSKDILNARANLGKGEITVGQYQEFIKKEIQHVIDFQEKVDLDLLVHGEVERNDPIEYFGEHLEGFVFTQNGWVQSYGPRYARPPIVVSDVSRPRPITVDWISYAQSLTKKPMKGLITGPVTLANWTFPREDVSRKLQAQQLALALRDEVIDLQNAGIPAIHVDEPALPESLPLRRSDWNEYLDWAVDAFKLTTAGVRNETQTHCHFCYSDFDDIFPSIQLLDADVLSIGFSTELLKTLTKYGYSNWIGPGVYDIGSSRIPSEQEIKDRLQATVAIIPRDLVFVNPDCGSKTRGWHETQASITNLVAAAHWARENLA